MTVLMESVQRQDTASVILLRSNLEFRRTMSLSYRDAIKWSTIILARSMLAAANFRKDLTSNFSRV